jgi:hypothetical protein
MPQINQLPLLDTPSSGDQIPVYSPNNGDARRMSLGALLDFFRQQFISPGAPTVQLVIPADGFNYTVADPDNVRGWVILRPLTTLAAGTVTLPPPSVLIDGMEITFNTTHQITSFSIVLNGASAIYGAPLTLAAEDWFSIRYDKTTNSWYRVA